MNLLKAATLVVADPDATAARYAEWFGYRLVDAGKISSAMAGAWGAPAVAGRRFVLCGPASGTEVYLRFIAGETPAGFRPLRTFGWAAIELCVQDVLSVHARLENAPFTVIGPPRLLDTMPEIFPMQVEGPDGEIVYLTEIRDDPPGVKLPRARCPVDQLFIAVLACADASRTANWLIETLGLRTGIDVPITYTMLARAFDLPIERKHRIITLLHGDDNFLEIDQYPEAATPRPTPDGALPPGVAMATMITRDFTRLERDLVAPAYAHGGALYGGARSGVVRSPEGVLVEVIEAL